MLVLEYLLATLMPKKVIRYMISKLNISHDVLFHEIIYSHHDASPAQIQQPIFLTLIPDNGTFEYP